MQGEGEGLVNLCVDGGDQLSLFLIRMQTKTSQFLAKPPDRIARAPGLELLDRAIADVIVISGAAVLEPAIGVEHQEAWPRPRPRPRHRLGGQGEHRFSVIAIGGG